MQDPIDEFIFISKVDHNHGLEIVKLFSGLGIKNIEKQTCPDGEYMINGMWKKNTPIATVAMPEYDTVITSYKVSMVQNCIPTNKEILNFVEISNCKVFLGKEFITIEGDEIDKVKECTQYVLFVVQETDELYTKDEKLMVSDYISSLFNVPSISDIQYNKQMHYLTFNDLTSYGSILQDPMHRTESVGDVNNTTYVVSAIPKGIETLLLLCRYGIWSFHDKVSCKISSVPYQTMVISCYEIIDTDRFIGGSYGNAKHWFIVNDCLYIEGMNLDSMFYNERIATISSIEVPNNEKIHITTRSFTEITSERDISTSVEYVANLRKFLPYRTIGFEFIPVKHKPSEGISYVMIENNKMTIRVVSGEIIIGDEKFRGTIDHPSYKLISGLGDGIYTISQDGIINTPDAEVSSMESLLLVWDTLTENVRVNDILGETTKCLENVISRELSLKIIEFSTNFERINGVKPSALLLGPDDLLSIHQWESYVDDLVVIQPEYLFGKTTNVLETLGKESTLAQIGVSLPEIASEHNIDLIVSTFTLQYYNMEELLSITNNIIGIYTSFSVVSDGVKLLQESEHLEIDDGYVIINKYARHNPTTNLTILSIPNLSTGIFDLKDLENSIRKKGIPVKEVDGILPLSNLVLCKMEKFVLPKNIKFPVIPADLRRGLVPIRVPAVFRMRFNEDDFIFNDVDKDKITEFEIAGIHLVRIGCIPDGHCMFHAFLKCIYPPYQEMTSGRTRSLFARRFRYELARHLYDVGNNGMTIFEEIDLMFNKTYSYHKVKVYELATLLAGNESVGTEMLNLLSYIKDVNIIHLAINTSEKIKGNPNPWYHMYYTGLISRSYYKRSSPTIIIVNTGGHYEAVGIKLDSGIKTVFTDNDFPIISTIMSTGNLGIRLEHPIV